MLTFGGQDVNNAGARTQWLDKSSKINQPDPFQSPRGGPSSSGAAPGGGMRERYLAQTQKNNARKLNNGPMSPAPV